ncbi:MAG: HDOD domain-containing protein [Myxococcota bacterium]
MPRILFVDDEPRVLDGLRHSLRTRRKVWEMSFAPSGAAALEELAHAEYDVIVSDMRMPGMDGAELLSQVAVLQPQAARIVLSGHMDHSAASRAARVAHRFIAKPCEPGLIEATIARTLELRDMLKSPTIQRCISGMGTLPSPPEACLALNEALEQDASMDVVARIIQKDVAMASKVLQLVNSSFFGMSRKIASVTQAVSYLGLNTMRNLVLAHSMFQAFVGGDLAAFEREQTRSLVCARIARALLSDKKQAELASTAALLHDVGILALQARLPREHREAMARAKAEKLPLYSVERERFGTTHVEVGAYLLGLWALPLDVIDAVANHHASWDDIQILDVNTAVRVAVSHASWLLLPADDARLRADPIPDAISQRLGLSSTLTNLSDELRPSIGPKPRGLP